MNPKNPLLGVDSLDSNRISDSDKWDGETKIGLCESESGFAKLNAPLVSYNSGARNFKSASPKTGNRKIEEEERGTGNGELGIL